MPAKLSTSTDQIVDPEAVNWYDFLQNKVNSFIKWDLVRFFHDNPHTQDTAANIADYVGRDPKTIERELDGLVAVMVLQIETVAARKIYHLTDDDAIRALVDAFMEACQDREFRVKAIHHVMQFTPRHDF